MFNNKTVLIICLVFIVFIAMSTVFANDNETVDADEVITTSQKIDIYFDATVDHDGDGSKENPYKTLNSKRIVNNSNIYLADGEYFVNTTNIYREGNYIYTSNTLISYSSGYSFAFSTLSNVSFYGQNADKTIIRGFDNSSLNFANNLMLNNLTFINNAIVFDGGNLSLNNVVFKDSNAHYWDNYYNKLGSAITIRQSSNVNIIDSRFINLTSEYGGAIYINYGSLNVINTTFINTTSTLLGGAIYSNNTNVIVSKSKFNNVCALNSDGGAIYTLSSFLNVFDSNFTNFKASFGGAICTLNSTSLINNSYFSNVEDNVAGVIFAMFGKLNISNSHFLNTNENTYSIVVSDIIANLNNNTFESVYNEILAYFSTLNHVGLDDKIIEINEFSFNTVSNDYPLFKFNLTEYSDDLPSYYNLVDDGYVSPVKNQKNGGNCWSFTAMAVIESCILKLTNKTYDLSEQNLKNLMAKYSNWGWNSKTNDGGKVAMTVGYLTSWLGPILDITDTYSDRNTLSHIYDEIFHIDNVLFLKRDNFTDNDNVKRAILTYGAVGGDLMYANQYLNENTNAYYCDVDYSSNHAITIVGWNDTYSASNFKITPEGDGAWIVKNSWGTDWGDNGFFYLSYYDRTLSKGNNALLYTVILNNTKHYEKNYQYDAGYTKTLIFNTDSFTYKNIFNSTGDEYLAAVSTYFFGDVNWTVNIYVNDEFKTNITGNSAAGYYTFDLIELVQLKKGDIFTVEVIQKTDGGSVSFPVSEISNMNRNVLSEGISYYKNGGQWIDMYTNQSGVICIKAFTITGLYAEIGLNATSTNITATVKDEKGDLLTTGNLIFNINGELHNVAIENGVASFDCDLTQQDYYNITATLNTTNYIDATKTIIIYSNLDMTLVINNVCYGENIVLNITLNNEVEFNDDVVVVINNKNYTIPISNQKTLYTIYDKLDVDTYTARLIYKGYFETINKTYSFNITKAMNNIVVSVEDTNYLDNVIIVVSADVDGIYDVSINDTIIKVNVVSGEGSNKTTLPIGKYEAIIDWFNSNYNTTVENATFWVNKSSVDMDLNVTVEYNTIIIKVNASQPINEEVIISTGIVNSTNKLTNGILRLNINNVPLGRYNVTLLFNNTNFDIVNKTVECVIESQNIGMEVSTNNISVGDNLVVLVKLAPDTTIVPSGNVTIFIGDINQTIDVDSTTLNFSISNLAYGNYTLKVVYSGDSVYGFKSQNISISVSKVKPNIILSNSINYGGSVALTISDGLSENILVNLNGVNYIITPSGTNFAVTFPNLEVGSYILNITYPGDDKYLSTNFTTSLLVNKLGTSISASSISTNVIAISGGISYSVALKDVNGDVLTGQQVHITYNGAIFSSVTGVDGVAHFTLYDVSSGNKQVIVGFDGDSNYGSSSAVGSISISKVKSSLKASKKTYKKSAKNKKVTATLKDASGKAIKNAKITFKIKNKKYSAKTKSNGVATIKAKLSKKGSYKVKVSYSGDNKYLSSSKTIALKIK